MAVNNLGLGFVFTLNDLASPGFVRMRGQFQTLQGSSDSLTATLGRVGVATAAVGAGMALAGAAALSAFQEPIRQSAQFGRAIAEVSTLVDEASFSTTQMRDITRSLGEEFGVAPVDAASALYQTISAGASDASEANATLRAAAQLAVGGVTDITTAVDGLTSIMNAYGVSADDAGSVTDTFFVAIKEGKTTAEELSGTIGRVAAQANSLNVPLEELFGSIAAITKGGIQTSEAVSGMKQVFAGISRPTADAAAEAQRLGIEFNSAALRTQGLSGFLGSITGNANFAADTFEKLFGSVEALNAIQALTAQDGQIFADVLAAMEAKAGATSEAFQRMSQTIAFQTERFGALKQQAQILIGDALAPLVRIALSIATTLINAFRALPSPMRTFVVGLAFAAAALLLVGGLVVGLGAGLVILLPLIKAAAVTLGVLAAVMAPLAIAFFGVAAAIGAMVIAVKFNLGGLGDAFDNLVQKGRLFINALKQLFSDGGFSGEVRDELNRADNQGLKAFALQVFAFVARIKEFFSGLVDGFRGTLLLISPVFDRFRTALQGLGEAFGIFGQQASADENAAAFDAMGDAGVTTGEKLANFAGFITDVLSAGIEIATGVVKGFRETWTSLKPALEFVVRVFRGLFDQIAEGIRQLGFMTESTGETSNCEPGRISV